MQKLPYSRVYLEITNICNKSCSFCHGTRRAPGFMSFDELKRALDSLEGLTEYIYFHLMGEPLLHPELPLFIKEASDRGFKCAVTTNGSLIEDRGEELLSSRVYKVNISLHSFEDGAEKDFLSYIDSVCRFADKASSMGILTVLRLWNNGHDGGKNLKIEELLKAHFKDEWVYGNRGARIRPKLHLEYGERFAWPDKEAECGGEKLFCYGLGDHFGILCDGTVVPCCLDSDGVISLGNIFSDDLKSILSSARAEAIKEGFKNKTAAEDLCRRCGYARRFKV